MLVACQNDRNAMTLEGTIKNVKQVDLYAYAEGSPNPQVDTIKVRGGAFSYERKLSQVEVLTLLFPNFSEMQVIAEPGQKLELVADASNLSETVIKGTKENELLTEFNHSINGKKDSEKRLAAQQFIYDNVTTNAAIAVFREHFVKSANPIYSEVHPLLDTLSAAQPDNELLRGMLVNFTPRLLCAVGQKLPTFEEVSLNGDTLTNKQYLGKPLVIAMWATWVRDIRKQLRNLDYLQKTYGNDVNFLHISLDPSRIDCQRYLKYDTVNAPVICDQQAMQSPLVSTFGVRQMPTLIIIDKEGVIYKRDVLPKDWETAIKELLK
jgi:thiol-disulfide isomerase/thioredoxin